MNTIAEVKLWGKTIGAAAYQENSQNQFVVDFEYDAKFQQSGIQVAPLMMPLKKGIYRFPKLADNTFHGLPGMLADALPDKFGNALIDTWLATQGRSASSFNAIERLCYMGSRGMGALEFLPTTGPKTAQSHHIKIDQLVQLASNILQQRQGLQSTIDPENKDTALKDILRVGTSAGGARAKAVIAWNQENNEIRSGQVSAKKGFEHWLLKFDGVSENSDKELNDPKGYGKIEYAYSLMAKAAGIDMTECRLFSENDRHHFMTKRFDRLKNGEKLHMQTLCAMAHFDFNLAGAYSYEQLFHCMRQLNLPTESHEQQFRRMVFNVIARNQDDHVKNIAFLMNKQGQWSLSPAYDIMFSFNPNGAWTAQHQMSINQKRDNFTLDDLKACGQTTLLKQGQVKKIVFEVNNVISQWHDFADQAKVSHTFRDHIWQHLRVNEIR